MTTWLLRISLFVLLASQVQAKEWHQMAKPSEGKQAVYGSYSAGCLKGAGRLQEEQGKYVIGHKSRNRFYGHAGLIAFIDRLSTYTYEHGLGTLIIGDMSQPRGGPFARGSGHRSHQIGLDVDLWFKRLGADEALKDAYPHSVVDKKTEEVNSHFSEGDRAMLKQAALDAKVERIFVHPIIKKELCTRYNGESWQHKIRPWWGHHQHFHVRLFCPEGEQNCRPQQKIDKSNSCDHRKIAWWFSKEAKALLKERGKEEFAPVLPRMCNHLKNSN